ncbi:MAG: EAL domain-containing protein [Thermodesulfobacteriota bacterium]
MKNSLRRRILFPLTLGLFLLLVVFSVSLFWIERKNIDQRVERRFKSAELFFYSQQENEARLLGGLLETLINDRDIREALSREDRKALLDRTASLFEKISRHHPLTHLYFSNARRVNLLRVHQPDRYGDLIGRLTTLKAEKTGETAYGLELGPLGTLTLRVVSPVILKGRTVGFVEAGEEINHLTDQLKKISGVEPLIFLYKKYLDRAGWEKGLEMLGRVSEWARFPEVVWAGGSNKHLLEGLSGQLALGFRNLETAAEIRVQGNRRYRCRSFDIVDTGSVKVGRMVVLIDVTEQRRNLYTTVGIIFIFCVGLGGVLFFLFRFFLGRVENQIALAQEKIIDLERDRTRMESEAKFNSVAQSMNDAVISCDAAGTMIFWNPAAAALFGYAQEEVLGRSIAMLIPERYREAHAGGMERITCGGRERILGKTTELFGLKKDGAEFPMELSLARWAAGEGTFFTGLIRDISDRKQTEETLRENEALIRNYLEYAPDGVYLSDLDGTFLYGNRKSEKIIGYTREELIGRNFLDLNLLQEKDFSRAALLLKANREGKSTGPDEIELIDKGGRVIPVEINTSVVRGKNQNIVLAFVRDISERKQAAEKIHLLHYYDSLTGLPNRTFQKELMKRSVEHARRHQEVFAVIYIGLDNFQRINDTLGHDIGDLLLKAVAERLVQALRKSDLVARSNHNEPVNVVSRVGGDEFIILAHDIHQADDAARTSRRILNEISAPYDLGGREVFITVSVGIALYPTDGEDVDRLLENAEKAMRFTKQEGKNNFHFFSSSMHSSVVDLLTLESDLHKALERNELILYYQPKVDAATYQIKGLEALIRWKHPDKGLLLPSEFIPLAESSGLIIPIGALVIRSAGRQLKTWREAGFQEFYIAMNVSRRQFDQQNLKEIVQEVLRQTGIPPQGLELEITESTIMRNPEKAIKTITELKTMGIRTAIDDFGTGYSSLSYLKRLPLDFLKIDQGFIQNLAFDAKDQAIVRATIAMAHSLDLKTIAEGVETREQLGLLKEYGCDEIQGFLFSRPLPPEEIPGILAKGFLTAGKAEN